jgi:hypothetical protein
MKFYNLSDYQSWLLQNIIENLSSGLHVSGFKAIKIYENMEPTWILQMAGVGNSNPKEIWEVGESDLQALSEQGYITLLQTRYGYSVNLTQKAYDDYKKYK